MVSFQTKDLKLSYTKISELSDCYLSSKSHVKGERERFPLSVDCPSGTTHKGNVQNIEDEYH